MTNGEKYYSSFTARIKAWKDQCALGKGGICIDCPCFSLNSMVNGIVDQSKCFGIWLNLEIPPEGSEKPKEDTEENRKRDAALALCREYFEKAEKSFSGSFEAYLKARDAVRALGVK